MASEATSDPLEATAGVASSLARETRSLDDRLTLIATRMTIVSLSFFFACFYFAQTYLQLINQNGMWKPAGLDHPSAVIGGLELGLMLASGLAYFGAQWAGLYRRNFRRLTLGLWIAFFLGLGALGVHIAEFYKLGFGPQAGGYASVFIATEGVFTGLLVVAVLVLFGVANRARLGYYQASGIAVEAFGEFWGWMSAIALMSFLALYVQPFFPIK